MSQPRQTALASGPITLTIPPDASMARVARLTASSIASLADFSIDEIDDIKIAVSEVVTLLLQQGDGTPVVLQFGVEEGSFSIDGSTGAAETTLAEGDAALTAAVLDAVSDEHELSATDGRIVIRVEKSTSSSEG